MSVAKYVLPVLILALLSGCVSYPIARNLQQQAKPVTLAEARANPDAMRGTMVIWGGEIINTTNETNGGVIYVLKLPLKGSGKPLGDVGSNGRFIAASPDFLDPEDYPHDRLITIAGQLNGVHTEPLQNIQYTYPVLDIKQTHLWKVQPKDNYYYGPPPDWWYWGYYPAWWYGGAWYYPGGYYGGFRGGYHGGGFHGGGGGGGGHH